MRKAGEPVREVSYPPAKRFAAAMLAEAARGRGLYGPMHSLHEAYGVIAEEVAEFFDMVRLRPGEREQRAVYEELVQVAAMAMRAALELVSEGEDT